jgi:hypothetical protein
VAMMVAGYMAKQRGGTPGGLGMGGGLGNILGGMLAGGNNPLAEILRTAGRR